MVEDEAGLAGLAGDVAQADGAARQDHCARPAESVFGSRDYEGVSDTCIAEVSTSARGTVRGTRLANEVSVSVLVSGTRLPRQQDRQGQQEDKLLKFPTHDTIN